MNDEHANQPAAAWRAADDRYRRIETRWKWTRLAMWLLAIPAVASLALGSAVWIPAVLTAVALAVGGDQVLRLLHADRARDEARQTLTGSGHDKDGAGR